MVPKNLPVSNNKGILRFAQNDIFIYAVKTFLLFILSFDRVLANTAAYANIFNIICILLSFTAIYKAGKTFPQETFVIIAPALFVRASFLSYEHTPLIITCKTPCRDPQKNRKVCEHSATLSTYTRKPDHDPDYRSLRFSLREKSANGLRSQADTAHPWQSLR